MYCTICWCDNALPHQQLLRLSRILWPSSLCLCSSLGSQDKAITRWQRHTGRSAALLLLIATRLDFGGHRGENAAGRRVVRGVGDGAAGAIDEGLHAKELCSQRLQRPHRKYSAVSWQLASRITCRAQHSIPRPCRAQHSIPRPCRAQHSIPRPHTWNIVL